MEGQIAEDFNTMSCHCGQLTGISIHFFFFLWTNIRYVKEDHKSWASVGFQYCLVLVVACGRIN